MNLYFRGYVESLFTAKITLPNRKGKLCRKKTIFFLKCDKGVVQPNNAILLDIFFEPCTGGVERGVLTITIENNPNPLVTQLKGYGMAPNLILHEETMKFAPILPYAHNCEQFVTIENSSGYAIEMFFSDYD